MLLLRKCDVHAGATSTTFSLLETLKRKFVLRKTHRIRNHDRSGVTLLGHALGDSHIKKVGGARRKFSYQDPGGVA